MNLNKLWEEDPYYAGSLAMGLAGRDGSKLYTAVDPRFRFSHMDYVAIDSNLKLSYLVWAKTEDANPGKGQKAKNVPQPMLPDDVVEALQKAEEVNNPQAEVDSWSSYSEMLEQWNTVKLAPADKE